MRFQIAKDIDWIAFLDNNIFLGQMRMTFWCILRSSRFYLTVTLPLKFHKSMNFNPVSLPSQCACHTLADRPEIAYGDVIEKTSIKKSLAILNFLDDESKV